MMNTMKYLQFFSYFVFILLSGCTSFQNLNIDSDLKKSENLRREITINLTIREIQKILFDYSNKCSKLNSLIVDPKDEKVGFISFDSMGLTQMNVGTLIEFNQKNSDTAIKGYSYYENWAKIHIDKIIRILQNPESCL
jgi:hypothetical protein